MSSVQFHMSDAVQRGAEHGMRIGMEAAMKSVLEEVVYKLSEKYEFDAKEAMEFLGVVSFKKPKKAKKVQLPWCGMVIPNCCQALKVNKGLHSQCLNDKDEGDFCKSCQKDADKNGGTPSKGIAKARLDADYTDAKGKAPVNYGNYMKKEGITREAAEAEAAKWGVTIPEEQFLVVDAKKGRKASSSDTETEDTVSEAGSVSEPETEETASVAGSVSEPEEEPEPVEPEPVEQEPVEPEPVEPEPVEQEPVEQEPVEDTTSEAGSVSDTETASETETKPKKKVPMPRHFTGTRDEWNAMNKDEHKAWKKENPTAAEAEKAAKKAAEKAAKKAAEKAAKKAKQEAKKKANPAKKAKQEAKKAKKAKA